MSKAALESDGYFVFNLGTRAATEVANARVAIRERIGCALEEAHEKYADYLLGLQAECRAMLMELPQRVIEAERDLFADIAGDFRVQRKPYLRIARPGVAADNIGFHKDTWYGGSADEVSVWIPLVDVDEEAALLVRPGSHKEEIEHEPAASDISRGSLGHALGFLYAPKRLKHPVQMTQVPMRCGQVLVMSLALLHGQEENRSQKTRWSMDCRVVCASKVAQKREAAYA